MFSGWVRPYTSWRPWVFQWNTKTQHIYFFSVNVNWGYMKSSGSCVVKLKLWSLINCFFPPLFAYCVFSTSWFNVPIFKCFHSKPCAPPHTAPECVQVFVACTQISCASALVVFMLLLCRNETSATFDRLNCSPHPRIDVNFTSMRDPLGWLL